MTKPNKRCSRLYYHLSTICVTVGGFFLAGYLAFSQMQLNLLGLYTNAGIIDTFKLLDHSNIMIEGFVIIGLGLLFAILGYIADDNESD